MRTRIVAALEFALLSPAVLFMAALIIRNFGFLSSPTAHAAQQIVLWYATRLWTLWALLLALPFAALVTGCFTLRHAWRGAGQLDIAKQLLRATRGNLPTLIVAASTLTAGVILAIVVLHMAAN